jgi:hypothetical protein
MPRKRTPLLCLVLVVAAAVVVHPPLFRAAHAAAAPSCTAATLNGPYAGHGQGFIARAPFVMLASAGFDGHGRVTGTTIEVMDGVDDSSTFAADYALNPDCTGSVHFTDHHHKVFFDNLHDLAVAVVDGGRRVEFVLAGTRAAAGLSGGPEIVVSGALERIEATPMR